MSAIAKTKNTASKGRVTRPAASFNSATGPGDPMAPGRALRVLIVEDNPVNLKVAVHQIRKLGGWAHGIGDGREAVQALARSSYDVVLMDCQMPDIDGYEAVREIRRYEDGGGRHTWIIAMTAHAMPGDREKCIAAGMDDYLSKPVTLEALRAALDRAKPARDVGPTAEESSTRNPLSEGSASAASLDPKVISELRREGANLLEQLIDLFVATSPPKIETMERALAERHYDELAFAAHTLKGIAGNLGAHRMEDLCGALERAARDGSIRNALDLFGALRLEHRRVCDALLVERPSSAGRRQSS